MTGTWEGTYRYGDGYGPDVPDAVPFVLSLTELTPGRFVGYVRDDASRGGQPERGRIKGTRQGGDLEFRKIMPVGYIIDEAGEAHEWETFLEAEGFETEGHASHEILYRGVVDGDLVQGEWTIRPTRLRKGDEAYETGGGSGTWSARRVSEATRRV